MYTYTQPHKMSDEVRPPPPPPPPLSSQDLEAYIRDGFILLKQAFPPQVAQACRKELWKIMKDNADIDRGDPNTWPIKFPLAEIYGAKEGTPWADVFTARLRQAVDQLCGKDQWEEFGCGWWMMTFPQQLHQHGHQQQQQEEVLAWGGLDGHWHIDGTTRQRCLHTREVGLIPIFLFSDVEPGGGGTALCRGSHHFVAQLLHEAGPEGLDALEIIQRGKVYANEMAATNDEHIVETVGQAGDVMFTHPFLIHGRSRNCAVAREESETGVRFMCHPSVRLKAFPSFEASPAKEMTPLEQGILQGLRKNEGQEDNESEVRIWPHDQCNFAASSNTKGEGGGPKKRKQPRHEQEVEDEEEAVDVDVLAIMGLNGFGGVGRGGANKKKKSR